MSLSSNIPCDLLLFWPILQVDSLQFNFSSYENSLQRDKNPLKGYATCTRNNIVRYIYYMYIFHVARERPLRSSLNPLAATVLSLNLQPVCWRKGKCFIFTIIVIFGLSFLVRSLLPLILYFLCFMSIIF